MATLRNKNEGIGKRGNLRQYRKQQLKSSQATQTFTLVYSSQVKYFQMLQVKCTISSFSTIKDVNNLQNCIYSVHNCMS